MKGGDGSGGPIHLVLSFVRVRGDLRTGKDVLRDEREAKMGHEKTVEW